MSPSFIVPFLPHHSRSFSRSSLTHHPRSLLDRTKTSPFSRYVPRLMLQFMLPFLSLHSSQPYRDSSFSFFPFFSLYNVVMVLYLFSSFVLFTERGWLISLLFRNNWNGVWNSVWRRFKYLYIDNLYFEELYENISKFCLLKNLF